MAIWLLAIWILPTNQPTNPWFMILPQAFFLNNKTRPCVCWSVYFAEFVFCCRFTVPPSTPCSMSLPQALFLKQHIPGLLEHVMLSYGCYQFSLILWSSKHSVVYESATCEFFPSKNTPGLFSMYLVDVVNVHRL